MKKTMLLWLFLVLPGFSQEGVFPLDQRYGFEVNLKTFPQKTPQEALKSLVRAWDMQQLDYLLAHLVDPGFVDPRVEVYKKDYPNGNDQARAILAFEKLVAEIREHLLEDPDLMNDLRRFVKDGEWEPGDETAQASVPQLAGRQVFFRRLNDRWFMMNAQRKRDR